VEGLEPKLEDAPVEDRQQEEERQPAGPAMGGRDPGRPRPGQLAEDPGRGEELAASKPTATIESQVIRWSWLEKKSLKLPWSSWRPRATRPAASAKAANI